LEPRFWRDRQDRVGASGRVGGTRGPVGVELPRQEAGWSQGQRCPATGDHESAAAASSSGLGAGCRARRDGGPDRADAGRARSRGGRGVDRRGGLGELGQLGACLPFRGSVAFVCPGNEGPVRGGEHAVQARVAEAGSRWLTAPARSRSIEKGEPRGFPWRRRPALACLPVPIDPISVRWTLHALDKAQKLGFARLDVESVLLAHHRERRRNAGRARWRVAAGRLVIAYEHPDGDDPLVARIVTVWRRR
jgi:hypothetical protein